MTFGYKSLINGIPVDFDKLLITKTAANNVLGGETVAWGSNDWGNVGDGTTIPRSSPVAISPGNDQRWFTSVATLESISGHTAGLKNDGSLWTWGSNFAGELGQGDLTHRSSPTQIGTSSWTFVSVGVNATFAIRSDGRLYSCGTQNDGQLGLNNLINQNTLQPVGTSSWVAVSSNRYNTYAIRSDGALFSWGRNLYGEGGRNDLVSRSSPVQIGASSWSQVSAGEWFVAAIRLDGALFTWGDNDNGQLGQNDLVHRSSPTQIGTGSWVKVSAVKSVAAIRSDGTLWSWGNGASGHLGIGDTDSRSSPVQVGTDTNWIDVDAGGNTRIAIKANGTAWASGQQVGLNTSVLYSSPVQIASSKYWRRASGQILIS